MHILFAFVLFNLFATGVQVHTHKHTHAHTQEFPHYWKGQTQKLSALLSSAASWKPKGSRGQQGAPGAAARGQTRPLPGGADVFMAHVTRQEIT